MDIDLERREKELEVKTLKQEMEDINFGLESREENSNILNQKLKAEIEELKFQLENAKNEKENLVRPR
jgi:DNA repair exonuclease SbcCD ATPase subunit